MRESIKQFTKSRKNLIPILQEIQKSDKYLSPEAVSEVSRFLDISENEIYSIATFYAQFRFAPVGRNRVMTCRGTACHVRGAPEILAAIERQLGIKEGETSPDMEYTLETVACIGCCGLAPCIKINEEVHGRLTPQKVAKIFGAQRKEKQNER